MPEEAKPGKTFPRTNIYHSDLVKESPLVAIVTGKFQKYGAKKPEIAYIDIPGDKRYGVRLEEGSPGYVEAFKAAPRGVRVEIMATGIADDNSARIEFRQVDPGSAPPAQAPDPKPYGGEGYAIEQPRASQTTTPPAPNRLPWPSVQARIEEALGAAIEVAGLSTDWSQLTQMERADVLLRITGQLSVAQERIYRETGVWLPFQAQETENGRGGPAEEPEPAPEERPEPPKADPGRMAALKALYSDTFLELVQQDPEKGQQARDQIERFLNEGGPITTADRMINYLTGIKGKIERQKADFEA